MTDDDVLRGYILKSASKQPKVTSVADGMASIDGRWIPFGTRLKSGWVVDGSKGEMAQLSFGGVPFEQNMGLGTVSEWKPPEPTSGEGSETEMDEQRAKMGLIPTKEKDGRWSVPQFKGQVFDGFEEAQNFIKRYGVTDRTSIEAFMKKKEAGAYGTLSDYMNSSEEQQRAGMKVFNNETGDFTDDFMRADPQPRSELDVHIQNGTYPPWDTGGYF